jgi:chemotaxis signal transduction protein
MQLLMFEYGREAYCMKISEVSEVLQRADVVCLPRVPSEFEGIFQLRGRPVTLLNFVRCFFGQADAPVDRSEILVFAEPRQHFGIRVPGSIEASDLECENMEIPPTEGKVSAVLDGVMKDQAMKVYNLLSADKIFRHAGNLIAGGGDRA